MPLAMLRKAVGQRNPTRQIEQLQNGRVGLVVPKTTPRWRVGLEVLGIERKASHLPATMNLYKHTLQLTGIACQEVLDGDSVDEHQQHSAGHAR